MSPKQKIFVNEYLKCFNATEAAARAHYKGTRETLANVGYENLRKPQIAAAIEECLSGDKSERGTVLSLPIAKTKRKKTFQKVYLIRAENGLVKIGLTVDVEKRLRTLNTASPIELELEFYFECRNARSVEKSLHNIFSNKRIKGEWFKLTDEDIQFIKSNYKTHKHNTQPALFDE